MGFLAPWFLAGTAVVGLPVWLHLLKKHKTTPLPFSSLMFFERRTQSSVKHRRLQYLLLFALRTAIVVLLALAFANPFVYTSGAAAAGGRKLLLLAVDNSFSMRQGGRLERARQAALSALSGIGGQDRAQVMAFGSQVRMMTEATNDVAALQAAIRAIEPGDTRGSYAELARALRSIAQSARTRVEVHLFSDMQKSGLPSNFADLKLPEDTKLVLHPVATARLPNFAVENVKVPRRVYDPRKVRLLATITGFGAERATHRVTLLLNGREVDSKSVEIPAGGRATVEFLSLEAPYGMNRGEVRLDSGDAFPNDDRFYFSVERADPRRVLFVHAPRNTRDLLYFQTALDSAGQSAFALDPVSPEQAAGLAPGKFAFVVLSDISSLPQSFEEALKTYVRSGGSVLVALGRESALRKSVPVFEEGVMEARYFTRDGDRFQTAAWLDPAYPPVRGDEHWDDVKFFQAVRIQPGKSRVTARLSDDTPLLLEKQIGEGRVLVFSSTFDNVSNDFPLHAAFVPFVEQTAHYLGRLDDRPATYPVGAYLELREAHERGAAAEVLDPAGKRLLSLEQATRAQNIQLTDVGYYDVKRPDGRRELVAVNPDRHESDLDVIPQETLALWQNTAHGAGAQGPDGAGERKPRQFWWYLILVLLALAVAESLLGNRHLSADREGA
jgi:hypothetical protein